MPDPQENRRSLSGWKLFKLAGIQVTIHSSWLIIFLLIVWSLSAGYLPRAYPGQSPLAYALAGLVSTLLFFASVLAHEFSHSLVARSRGIPVPNITLFVFGGISQMSEEASEPKTELAVSVVGPLTSFGLAVLFWLGYRALAGDEPTLAATMAQYLMWVNVALGVFNLIPGFPLDGGRVLRAVLWWKTGSLTRATRWASDVGKAFAYTLMALGAVRIFAGALVGGIWMIFIGLFLRQVAEGSYQQTVMRTSLEGVDAGDVMVEDYVGVAPDLSVADLIDEYFLHYGHKGFPVMEDGRLVGIVSLKNAKHVSREERESTSVADIMNDVRDTDVIAPDTSLADALNQMNRAGTGRLMVMKGDTLAGIVTRAGLNRFVEIKKVLEG